MNISRPYTMDARAEQVAATRERIARAGAALFLEESFEDVTLARIAQAAGVSHQTVLNHFQSKEGVALGAAEVMRGEIETTRYAATPGDIASAVHALVDDYERMGDANVRWAMTSDRFEGLAAILDDARRLHQDWLVAMFGDGLPTGAARKRAIRALHAATDVYTWKLLRRDLGLGRRDTERAMADLVAGIVGGNDR